MAVERTKQAKIAAWIMQVSAFAGLALVALRFFSEEQPRGSATLERISKAILLSPGGMTLTVLAIGSAIWLFTLQSTEDAEQRRTRLMLGIVIIVSIASLIRLLFL